MTRIFSTLAVLDVLLLCTAFGLGFWVGDAASPAAAPRFTVHFLTGLGALVFATMVHSIVLTYFMGTGRWIEETSNAYRLGETYFKQSRDLKWRVLPFLGICVLLLIGTGALGAAADPASTIRFQGALGLSPADIHQLTAAGMLAINVAVHVGEFMALHANARIIEAVLADVRRMRLERGLPVD